VVRFLVFSFYLIIASITTHLYFDMTGEMIGTATEELVDGSAKKPFAYRMLVPFVMGEIVAALPQKAIDKLEARKADGSWRKPKSMNYFRWNGSSIPLFVLSYLMVWGMTLWLLYCWRAVLRAQQFGPVTVDLAPAIALLAVPMLLSKAAWIYDFPELLFFSLGLLFFIRKQWLLYYGCFVLGLLNKETAVLMAVYFLPHVFQERAFVIKHLLIQGAIAFGVLLAIRLQFADRPGEAMQFNLKSNLEFIFSREPWFKFSDAYAYQLPSPRGFNILNFFLFVYPLWLARDVITKAWRNVVLIMLAVLFPLFVVSGFEDEFRVFLPLVPAFIIIYVQAIQKLFFQYYANQAWVSARDKT